MAGTATVRIMAAITDLGQVAPLSTTYTVSGVDEYAGPFYEELAATTTVEVSSGQIDTVTGMYIKLVSGGTTAATGLSIDIAAASDWTTGDMVLVSGQSIFFVPVYTAGDETYIKNLNSSAATIQYLVFGDST